MKFIELLAEFKNADSVEWIDACEEQPEYDAVRFYASDGIEYTIVMDGMRVVNVYAFDDKLEKIV